MTDPVAPEDASHLAPRAREFLSVPGAERIIQNWDRIWIGHPDTKKVQERLDLMLITPPSTRPRNLLVFGESNVGKSTILKRWADRTNEAAAVAADAEDPEAMGEWAHLPVVRIQTPPKGDEIKLYDNILDKMGFPLPASYSGAAKWRTVLLLLKRNRTKVIIMDELHNALSGRFDQRLHFNVVLKNLTNETGIPLAVAGIDTVDQVFRKEDQLHRRFSRIKLERWRETQDWRVLLRSFEKLIPLRHASHLDDPAMATLLYEVSNGLIGELSDVLREAALKAVLSGEERITRGMIRGF